MGVSGFTALALAGLLLVSQAGATERLSGPTAAPKAETKDVPKPRPLPLIGPAPKPQFAPFHGPPPKPTPAS
jgi:hypothetical protein